MDTIRTFTTGGGEEGKLHSLPALQEQGIGEISRLPVSIRIVLESVLRNCDGVKVTEEDVRNLANWNAASPAPEEIPFIVARIVLQDFTGVPLLVDLAALLVDLRAALSGRVPLCLYPDKTGDERFHCRERVCAVLVQRSQVCNR